MGRGKRIIPEGMPDKLKAVRIKHKRTMERMAQILENELEIMGYKNMSIQSGIYQNMNKENENHCFRSF